LPPLARQVGFVIYNAGDTLGRNLPGAVRSPRWLLGLTLLRTAFVPLFMMCNVVPSSGASPPSDSPPASPPLASDAWPLLVMAVFSLSNGWLTTCALMHAPEAVPPSERGRAGSLMICFLNGGLFVGSALSFAVKSTMCGGCNPFVTPGSPAAEQSQYYSN
jgi:equilibrative nucleoside transporter 1/2/3